MDFIDNWLDKPLNLLVIIVVFILSIIVTRAIFSIPKILRYNKAQTLLLIKIARQQGVTEQELDTIIDVVEPKPDPNSMIREKATLSELDKKR